MQVIPVILSGGSGTRLWPLSRKSQPKPFIPLPDGETLIQKTLQRILGLESTGPVLTVTNRDYYFLTRDAYAACAARQSRKLPASSYLLEPTGRNTAPAIAAAALWAQRQQGEDAVLLFLPADHVISDEERFRDAVEKAVHLAQEGYLVTFGIIPTRPETGYGYIQQGQPLSHGFRVQRFVEKPDAETAEDLLQSGHYLWNSGMFCLRASDALAGLEQHAPELLQSVTNALDQAVVNGDTWELGAVFGQADDISIDYALMEKADNVAVVRAGFGWNDVGSWTAYAELSPEDNEGNRLHAAESVLVGTRNCMVHSPHRLIALVGVEDIMVVDTPDAILVAHRSQDQEVKAVVRELKARGHAATEVHRTAHRPWGSYTVLEEGDRFKIKHIVVKPKEQISLQMHHHRSEHWIVVSGTAKIVNGEMEKLILTNESAYIPAGHVHRLENPGVIELVMIEVQSGEYLGEDDIVRFQDVYGRC